MLCKKALNAPLFRVMFLRGGDVKCALGNYQEYSGEVPNGDYILKKANTVENMQAIENKQEVVVAEAMIEAALSEYHMFSSEDFDNDLRLVVISVVSAAVKAMPQRLSV